MKIHNDFVCGNIAVQKIENNVVYLKNELRDSTDFFYWAFCVEGAQGKTLTFRFEQSPRLGYWGPAVSHDLKTWKWHDQKEGESFTYSFGANESKVYFAQSMLYTPDHFTEFATKHDLNVTEFCKSRNGASVPCVQIGEGEISIILTSRHHACEHTGSYAFEGVLEQLLKEPIPNTRVLVVPFMDYDGVVAGDQGKNRQPHNHNMDYLDSRTIYPEVRALKEYVAEYGAHYAFDFHSPNIYGLEANYIYFMRNWKVDELTEFSDMLESNNLPDGIQYYKKWDYPAGAYREDGQSQAQTFHGYMLCRPENVIASTNEVTYQGTTRVGNGLNKVSQTGLRLYGNAFGITLKQFVEKYQLEYTGSPTVPFDKVVMSKNEYYATTIKEDCEQIDLTVKGANGGATLALYLEQTDGSYKLYGRVILSQLLEGQTETYSLRDLQYLDWHDSNRHQPSLGLTLDASQWPDGRGCKVVWFAGERMVETEWCEKTHGYYTADFKIVPTQTAE